jgi:pyruvate kinase
MRTSSGTKIIATVGPMSRSAAALAGLVRAGVDGFRINCSHTRAEELPGLVADIKEAGGGFIIADLAGPKLRCENPISGKAGEVIELGGADHPLNNEIENVTTGAAVSLGDGNMVGTVIGYSAGVIQIRLTTEVATRSGSAVHIEGSRLVGGCLGPADEEMLEAALEAGCDWIALSYVKDGVDAARAAGVIRGRAGVIAKIERESAVEDLEAICNVVGAVMVARGDLGVELDYVQVPRIQREIFNHCRSIGMPVVCATEMLGSMVSAARPTRAEVSDVEAVMRQGYDAIVLTAETAMGVDPVAVIEVAKRIQAATEAGIQDVAQSSTADDAVMAEAAVRVGEAAGAECIVAMTSTGHTARLVAAERARLNVYAVAGEERVARKIALYYGVKPVIMQRDGGVEGSSTPVLARLVELGLVKDGEKCVFIGSRIGPEQDADLVMIRRAPTR